MNFRFLNDKGVCKASFQGAAIIIFSLVLFVSSGTVLAHGSYTSDYAKSIDTFSHEPSSSSTTDACLPLLKTIRHTPSAEVVDRNQRSAGTAAALGLVFGVRFALSPPQQVQTHDTAGLEATSLSGNSLHDDRPALAIASYRQCQKQQALNALME